jgi:hypothetical protein
MLITIKQDNMINKKSNAKLPQNKKVGGVPRKDWKPVTNQDIELGRQKATRTGEYGVYGSKGINAPDYTGVPSDKVALYEHNRKVNKFAMETGVTPNYDSIQNRRAPKGRDGMTSGVGDAMRKFYESPDSHQKMKQAEKDFIKTQAAGYKKPTLDQARVAGGSRPMHQASTVQIDPMTGLPLQANAPNMGNFGGAMGMSNVPMYDQSMSPGAIAQSSKLGEAAGKFGTDMINKKLMKEERYRAEDISQGDQGYRSSQYVPDPNPIKNLDVGHNMTGKHSAQAKTLDSRNINGVEVLGGNQPTKQSGLGAIVKLPQDYGKPKS